MAIKLHLSNKINFEDGSMKKYGELIALLSLLEWYLEQVLMLIILKRKFDSKQKVDQVLESQISGSNFSYKITLIKKFDLLSKDLEINLDIIRKRRNIFIHGLGVKINEDLFLQNRNNEKESFTVQNISKFIDFVENTGGTLTEEFKKAGFDIDYPKESMLKSL